MNLPAGILTDKFGRKRTMIFGLATTSVSAIISGLAPTYGWLILGRIFQGLGSAIYMTSALTWIAETSAGEYRGRFMSLHAGFSHVGIIFGPALGGYTALHYGLNGPFFVYGGLILVGLLMTLPLKEEKTSSMMRSNISLVDITSLLSNRSFLLISFAVLTIVLMRAGIGTLIPLYGALNMDLNEAQIGILLTVVAVTSTSVIFAVGWLSDKVGRKIPIMLCLVLTAITALLIPMQQSMNSLLVALALYGFASGFHGSLSAWPADVAPKDRLGAAMGTYRVIGDVGMALGPVAVTYAAEVTGGDLIPFISFMIPSVLSILVAISIIWADDPAAKRKAHVILDEPVIPK